MTRGEIVKTVLGVVAVAGIIPLVLVAPGAVKLLPLLASRPERVYRRTTDKILRRFESRGWAKIFVKPDGSESVSLTERGREEVLKYELRRMTITSKTWDQCWRVVMFDVRMSRDYLRKRLRLSLKSFGFSRLQDSVWIHPHECEEIVELLRTMLRLRGEVLYLTCVRFRGDKWLVDHYDLLKA